MSREEFRFTLTTVDTSGIQPYIFGSNVLGHNVGASYLVDWITGGLIRQTLQGLPGSIGTNITQSDEPDSGLHIEAGQIDAELVYAGGGNTFILFRTRSLAEQFARTYTKQVLEEAPGLQIVLTHVSVRWDPETPEEGDILAQKVAEVIRGLGRKKRDGAHRTSPIQGRAVTADCQFTGLPAVGELPRSKQRQRLQRVSAEVHAKHGAVDKANKRLEEAVKRQNRPYRFLYNFDEIGTKDEFSYLAVVHIDGNGMGKRVKRIAQEHDSVTENRNYINAMRRFSRSIENASEQALQQTVAALVDAIDPEGKIGGKIEVSNKMLPFRPIVFGGDDATFVCDGRLGLALAEKYMQVLMAQELADGQKLSVRAGIAIVKTHYPFARSYELAEALAKSAKTFLQSHYKDNDTDEEKMRIPPSAIDWHFASTGLVLDLETVRKREFLGGKLLMRPLLLDDSAVAGEWRTWPQFKQVMKHFSGEKWAEKRSKLKGLRSALHDGPDAVQQYMTFYEQGNCLPKIPGHSGPEKSGWVGKERCTSYGAIEALDFYVTLENVKKDELTTKEGVE